MDMRADAKLIYTRAIDAALPDNAVRAALKDIELQGNIYVAAVGKAAWQMGKTVSEVLGSRIKAGIVVTKHGYGKGAIERLEVYEAGHPVPDDDSYAVQGAGALGQGKDGKVYAAAQAVGNTTAGDMAMTLVSVDPENFRFVPVAGGENVICSADTIYPWKMVAAGVSETADFILWGYNGVETYRLGETEFTRVQENWEMPCGTEGTCAVLVPDLSLIHI